jgi:hypothetical protein
VSKEKFAEIMKPSQPEAEVAQGGLSAILSAAKDIGGQAWDAAKPMFDHGRTELAAALFRGDAHVMYMKSSGNEQEQKEPDHGLPPIEAAKQPEVEEQSRGREI